MKNIKELGLELIELEDQVLLIESKVGGGKLNDWVKLSIPKIERVEYWNEDLVGFCNKIVSSTKPIEGLPLLVIEDEVNFTIQDRNFKKQTMNPYPVEEYAFTAYEKGFIEGYNKSTEFHNKAKETYKFTEEDLRKAIDGAFEKGRNRIGFFESDYDSIIKSLTKKELYVEIELIPVYDNHGNGDIFQSDKKEIIKITEGKIKAIWKEK